MAIFLKFDSIIVGESTNKDHTDWIQIDSLSHGLGIAVSSSKSSSGSRTSGIPTHSEISCSKMVDKASIKMMESLCNSENFNEVIIEFTEQIKKNEEVIMRMTLNHVVISSISISASGASSEIGENFSLNYGKIKWEYMSFKQDTGAKAGQVAATWNLLTNKPS